MVQDGAQQKDSPHVATAKQPVENGLFVASSKPIATHTTKAGETSILLEECFRQLISFISQADQERNAHRTGSDLDSQGTSLIHPQSINAEDLQSTLSESLRICDHGGRFDSFQSTLADILRFSVNPTAPGFMDKLYSAPLPPGIAAELILAVLNTNVHVYQVSPVLTLVERHVTKELASLFGLNTPRAGGITVAGGSASNLTSIVVARNSLFPETKTHGNLANGRQLVMFTSAHGHYSIEKAAQGLGFGSAAVIPVPTDAVGRMRSDELERLMVKAKSEGKTPFYVNATAGTTVLGSFDPFEEISAISRRHRCWMHIDGAWGGSFIFSQKDDFAAKTRGTHLADSIAINPHKMLGVPITCSILLTRDLRLFQSAMTLKAGYLFHETEDDDNRSQLDPPTLLDDETAVTKDITHGETEADTDLSLYDLRDTPDPSWTEPNDLADMTLQCGRRGDSLKLFMCWQYYGTRGYADMIEAAYDTAVHLSTLVDTNPHLTLVLGPGSKPSCLQVCFYYTPNGCFVFGLENQEKEEAEVIRSQVSNHTTTTMTTPSSSTTTTPKHETGKLNSRLTSRISRALIPRGFMVDYAPALEGQEDRGAFFRVVVNISTERSTVERLVADLLEVGEEEAVKGKH